VQLVDVSHLLPTAHAACITGARQIATTMTSLVRVVVERRAIALIAVPNSHELHAAHILAELEAQLWCHWHPVFLWNLVLVPELLLRLCVKNASNVPHSCRAAHWVNGVWAWEPQLSELLHCANESGLPSYTFHSQTFAPEAAAGSFRLFRNLHKTW
jgi:hypothetical protein